MKAVSNPSLEIDPSDTLRIREAITKYRTRIETQAKTMTVEEYLNSGSSFSRAQLHTVIMERIAESMKEAFQLGVEEGRKL